MKHFSKIFIFTILICVLTVQTVQSLPLNIKSASSHRHTRQLNFRIFSKTTTTSTTTVAPILPNDLLIGKCGQDDKLIYVDDTRIESNNSTLSGTIEVYLDTPYTITCAKVIDQMKNGTGAIPTEQSGGPGHKFLKIDVQGKYGYGIHFRVLVFGKIQTKAESETSTQNVAH